MIVLALILVPSLLILAAILRKRAPIARPMTVDERLRRYDNALPFAPDYTEASHLRRQVAGAKVKRKVNAIDRRCAPPLANTKTNVIALQQQRRA